MTLSVSGTVMNRITGQGEPGLWVELRASERVVARAAEPTTDDGWFTFEADDEALREVLGDEAAELILAVLGGDGRELPLAEPAIIIWPLETDTFEFGLTIEPTTDVLVTGVITNRVDGQVVPGLWVELRHEDRPLARSSRPTDLGGRFEIPINRGALVEIIGDAETELPVVILAGDSNEVTQPEPGILRWPVGDERIALDLAVELPGEVRPPSPIDAVSAVLQSPAPATLLTKLREWRVESLGDIRASGGLVGLGQLTEPETGTAQALEAHARLEVLSPNLATNDRLVRAGIASVTDLAEADPATLVRATGIPAAQVQTLQTAAMAQRAMISHDVANAFIGAAPVNAVYTFDNDLVDARPWLKPFLPPAPPADACQACSPCTSALSPAAYLVDLLDFLIDNFHHQVVQTATSVTPKGFPNLKAIEDRFGRPFGKLVVDCANAEKPVCQIEIAIEVLEPYVSRVAGKLREDVYAAFEAWVGAQPRFPHPDVLSEMFDAYLGELDILRTEFNDAIADAWPAGGAAGNDTKLNVLLLKLGVTKTVLRSGLDLQPSWKPHIKALDWLPQLVRTAKTKGLDPDKLADLATWTDANARAEAAIDRVNSAYLPRIRDNFISYALYPLIGAGNLRDKSIANARDLGNLLYIDLEAECCGRTTHLASAIEAIQSWVEAFRSGREDPGYYLMFTDQSGAFGPRWEWLRSYGTWQAAQSVLLYPENFLLPGLRQDRTQAFTSLLDDLADAGSDANAVRQVVETCRIRIAARWLIASLLAGDTTDDAAVVKAIGAALSGLPQAPTAAQHTAAKNLLITLLVEAKMDQARATTVLNLYSTSLEEAHKRYLALLSHPTSTHGLGLESFRKQVTTAYATPRPFDPGWTRSLDEWFFFVPLAVADHLNGEGAYDEAAAWLHNVFYPFTGRYPSDFPFPPVRFVWPGFTRAQDPGYSYRNSIDWLSDPFNPFAIAATRAGAWVRHVVTQYVENLLDWADAEFARDTGEAVARARELYELAAAILGAGELPPDDRCRGEWQEILLRVATTFTPDEARTALLLLGRLMTMDGRVTATDLARIDDALATNKPAPDRLADVKTVVDIVRARPAPATILDEVIQQQTECQLPGIRTENAFNSGGVSILGRADLAPAVTVSPETELAAKMMRKIGCGFCVPANPVLTTLRYRIESNLAKIKDCRNFAGMKRTLPLYVAGADPMKAIQASAAGESIEETAPSEPPPLYRFSYLIERARYYTDIARQLEGQLLAAFEKEDAEAYTLLQARQGVRVASANITLQDLRLDEANDGVDLARLQRDRASFQNVHFSVLISSGLLAHEKDAIDNLWVAHRWMTYATITGGIGSIAGAAVGAIFGSPGGPPGMSAGAVLGGIAGAVMGGGQIMRDVSSIHSLASQARAMQATFERREQEWRFQLGLARWDVNIGNQNIVLANDRVAISRQEREIALLQDAFAREVVDFLGAKFTNIDLWRWMGKTLRRYYRDHLAYATVIARMAQTALEFERQESIPIVATGYFNSEKRDLLAAEQLLTDINKLDQHRLTTEKRRKELTKTFSLSQLDPIGFSALRQGHGMVFATPMSHFDRDFPGHYLRLVKSVSLTVLALVPPNESIQATLSNAGISRVMVGPPFETPKVVQRLPESIAVTAANNGTGLFELRFDDPILLPFEGAGVETNWILDLPRGANRFSFDTLADVLFTVRYTAHEDSTYREKVLTQLGMGANRKLPAGGSVSFPLRSSLPDEWYDLFNPTFLPNAADYGFEPGKVKPPYTMQFDLGPGDFPPNELDHTLSRLTIAMRQSTVTRVPIEVWFKPAGKPEEYRLRKPYGWDPAVPATAPVSEVTFQDMRTGPTAPWQTTPTAMGTLPPFGTWRLRLRNETGIVALVEGKEHNQNRFRLDWLDDILFVVNYNANVEYRYAS